MWNKAIEVTSKLTTEVVDSGHKDYYISTIWSSMLINASALGNCYTKTKFTGFKVYKNTWWIIQILWKHIELLKRIKILISMELYSKNIYINCNSNLQSLCILSIKQGQLSSLYIMVWFWLIKTLLFCFVSI